MKIDVQQVNLRSCEQYPYTHRVEVSADSLASDKVSDWLKECSIPHVRVQWGVFYLNKQNTEWLLLRFQ